MYILDQFLRKFENLDDYVVSAMMLQFTLMEGSL
jgi:hypothetical protein